MHIIHYGFTGLRTADAVAIALVDYAEALAARGRFAVAEVPTASANGAGTARLLLGPGIPLVSIVLDRVASPDAVGGDTTSSDTTSSDTADSTESAGLDDVLSPFVVRSATRRLMEESARISAPVTAQAVDSEMLGDFWELMRANGDADR